MNTAEQDQLQAWLRERELDAALTGSDDPPAATQHNDDARPFTPVKLFQIRLLKPHVHPTDTPRFVAILATNDEKAIATAVPFSRFATPATPGECATERSESPLRVLCLWNACDLSAVALAEESWHCGDLDANQGTQLNAHLQTYRSGSTPAATDIRLFGARLVHPLDPRQTYLDEERALTQAIREVCTHATPQLFPQTESAREALPVAAEAHEPYGHEWRLTVSGLSLVLACSGQEDSVNIQVLDKHENPANFFDGGYVSAQDGSSSGPIWDGRIALPKSMYAPLTHITSAEGLTHALFAP
ncbi:MAG: hypothetical protein ACI9OU_001534 [Candidatus Promineifilaceae bacterium]|jgi:hypothetical protein